MKVIRIYDDRRLFYNNIDLSELCSEDVEVEYCTFDNNNPTCTIVDKSHNNMTVANWDLNLEKQYYVFLDTRWDKHLINETEEISYKVTIPIGLINQLQQPCVVKLKVYTSYGPDESLKLIDALKQIDDLADKVENELFSIRFFQPIETINSIRREFEQWINI